MKLKKYICDILILASLGLCLNFLRDPFAAADATNYIDFFDGKTIFQEALEPGLVLVRDAFSLLPIILTPLLQYLITCLIPLIIITLISCASRSMMPIMFYLSSEVFVLLSFNGIRQGISSALLSAGVFVVAANKGNNISKIIASILLLLSLITHRATAGIIAIVILACIISYILSSISAAVRLRMRSISKKNLIIAIVLIVFVAVYFPFLKAHFLNAFISYRESTNVTSETGIMGPIWRVLYSLTLFQLISRYTYAPNIKFLSKTFTISGIIILLLVLAGFGIGANRLTYQLPFMGVLLLALNSHNSIQLNPLQADTNSRDLNRYCIYLFSFIYIISYTSKAVQLQIV